MIPVTITTPEDFHHAILTRTEQKRWTMVRLSVEAGVPYSTLRHGLTRKGTFTLHTALQLAHALNLCFVSQDAHRG